MVLARNVEEAERAVRTLREEAGNFGLEMNMEKSKCMIFNGGEEMRAIEGLEVVEEIKYLGVKMVNKRKVNERHRKEMIEKGKRMSNMTYSVIERSFHRVGVGKVY